MTTVLDTNVLLRWTHEPERLSARVAAILAANDTELVLCSISVWEVAWKSRIGKLDLGMTAVDYVARLGRLDLRIVPVDVDPSLRTVALQWSHRDPVDRTIVALAQREGAQLLSSDREIRAFYGDAVW